MGSSSVKLLIGVVDAKSLQRSRETESSWKGILPR